MNCLNCEYWVDAECTRNPVHVKTDKLHQCGEFFRSTQSNICRYRYGHSITPEMEFK